jgi:hypothetical protein
MKTLKSLFIVALMGFVVSTAPAADKKVVGGPKGGRLLEMDAPRAEFFVEKDKTVSLTFYDANLKPVAVTEQTATATAETKTKAGKVKMEFEKKGDALVSKTALPEGEGYNVVVQVKAKADGKPKNFRISLDLNTCGECKRAEYACTCGH